MFGYALGLMLGRIVGRAHFRHPLNTGERKRSGSLRRGACGRRRSPGYACGRALPGVSPDFPLKSSVTQDKPPRNAARVLSLRGVSVPGPSMKLAPALRCSA